MDFFNSVTGLKDIKKRRLILTLKIVKINYFASDHLALEIKGRNIVENEYLSIGDYHTL